jgi:beta-lactamase superfamily II metal-dependent hydrolase
VVVPVTALALASGMGSLLVGGWLPSLAVLFNNATWALMKFIIWFSGWAAQWWGGNFNVASPSWTVCGLYYVALFLGFSGWIFRSRHKWTACAALLAAGVACLVHWTVERQTVRISILPLRGAPAVFVDAPGRAGSLLLDCGDTEQAARIVKPLLCAHGVNHLDAFCLGVGLRPHFDGAKVILTNFLPRKIFTGAAPERSAAYRELLDTLRQTGCWRTAREGDNIAGWSVLHPAAAERLPQADDNALVLRREFHGHSVLLLPALGRDGQDALMRRHPDLRAELVVAGLPARDEPLC